ncbi:hypothetical protein DPMN_068050 [Dreissena polymorpha]|uniref:Uncharacterized protein n=2 Tax=Dreissena polymorpha TaxID=45954 RepID=A0A9D3Z0W4_DREPO|nr:hypothetical protein DPMN_068050 [Dreissena polymorpha]
MPIPGGYMSPLSSGAGAKSHTSLAQASFISYTQENGDAADEEAPPPLPDKQSHEHSSLNSEPPPIPSRTSAPSRTPRKSKPLLKSALSSECEASPPVLPDKLTPSKSFESERL